MVNRALMIILAACAALGGLDRMTGSRLGLGRKFDEAFLTLGPLALSMAGIMCLVPALSGVLMRLAAPLKRIGVDPALWGGLIAIDMGGYPLAMSLMQSEAMGRFCGIVIASTFGCTAVYTVPVGCALVPEDARADLLRGLGMGLCALPIGLMAGGLSAGLGIGETFRVCLPVIVLAALLLWGLIRHPQGTVRAFSWVGKALSLIGYAGLILGAVRYMTGFEPIPGLMPLEEAMAVISSIGIVLLGSLPLAALLERLLKKPISRAAGRAGMNTVSGTGLIVGLISVTPALQMMKDMDARGRTVNAAALVCGASAFSAHLAFTVSAEPDYVMPMLAAKLTGALFGAALALFMTRRAALTARTRG